jgi:hypothetical protein
MNAWEYAISFLRNQSKLIKYNEAIAILRDIGFETVMRRLGEPSDFALGDPEHATKSAFEHAEKRGWYQALSFLFDFADKIQEENREGVVGDYGASERMKDLGYGDIKND